MTPVVSPIIEERTEGGTLQPLAALLAHPEFVRGLNDAREEFLEGFEPEPLTQEEMIEEVEMHLSFAITQRCRRLSELFDVEPPCYIYDLGFVLGTINEGLSYAPTAH